MKLEEVTAAIEREAIVTTGGDLRYRITGLLSRYNRHRRWYYSVMLQDMKTNSVTYARVEDVELTI